MAGAATHRLSLPGPMLRRGFWLYVWDVETPCGQMLYVVPSAGLTVVMTSKIDGYQRGTGYVEELHALLGEAIIPAVMSGQSLTH